MMGPNGHMPDWCTPLEKPRWVEPARATLMRDEDPVLGFEAGNEMWAIPWWVMKNHHVANLTFDGEQCLVTLCEACVGGGIFDPVVAGRRLSFQNNGWYRGSPLMTDDATGSLWAMINATPLAGPAMEWGQLPMRPIVHFPWAQWRAMYPESLVVHGEGEPRDGHGADFYGPHHAMTLEIEDTRLASDALIVAVEVGAHQRAYPLSVLHAAGGIAEDVLGSKPIAVVTHPDSWLALTFERELDGAPIRLRWDGGGDQSQPLVDRATGSRFTLWGECVDGEYAGFRLRYVRSSLKKWGHWQVTHPDGDVWSLGGADIVN